MSRGIDASSQQAGTFVTSIRRTVDIPTRAAVADAISAGGRCGSDAIDVIAHDSSVDTVRCLSPSHWAAASLVAAFFVAPVLRDCRTRLITFATAVIPAGGTSRRGPHGNLQAASDLVLAPARAAVIRIRASATYPSDTHARLAGATPGNPLFSSPVPSNVHLHSTNWASRPIKTPNGIPRQVPSYLLFP